MQVDTAALVPLLTKAVQDLAAQVADLQAQLAAYHPGIYTVPVSREEQPGPPVADTTRAGRRLADDRSVNG